jgi:hypothetical protein
MENSLMAKSKIPRTPIGTFSYPYLFEKNQWGSYATVLIFPPGADTSEMEELIEAAAKEKWPKGRPKNFHNPLRDNSEEEGKPEYVEGGTYAKFKSTTRPKVVGPDPRVELTEEDVYPGMQGLVSYVVRAYSKDGGNGVRLQLVNAQKTGEGEPLAGVRSNPEDDFESFDELADALGE